ncbi:MAG TPA: hypothetical protein VF463_17525 [Sphingobium sp.]
MPASLTLSTQILFVALSPALLALAPSQGAVRTVALRPVPLSAIVNAVLSTDGRILAGRGDGGLVVTGRRDRIALALLPLGVLALPTVTTGCIAGQGG